MAGRRCDGLDVRETLQRLRLGESARAVANRSTPLAHESIRGRGYYH